MLGGGPNHPLFGLGGELLDAEHVVDERGLAVLRRQRAPARRRPGPPWAMITPSAPLAGTSTSAVTENDLFLMLTTLLSDRRKDRRGDIDDVGELRAQAAGLVDPVRPVHDRPVAGAAPVRGHLLGPLERGVHRPGPTDRVVVIGGR